MAVKPAQKIVKKVVVIEEALLISMANNQAFTKEFKFLAAIQRLGNAQAKGCSSCGGRGKSSGVTQHSQAFQNAKQNIVGMGADQKKKLKKLLNTEKIRVSIKQGNRIVQTTF